MSIDVALIDSASAEAYLIGAALSDSSILDEYQTRINPDMFANRDLGVLWGRMRDLQADGQPSTLNNLVIAAPEIVKRVGIKRLYSMQNSYLGSFEVNHYADKLTEMHVRRQIIKGCMQLSERAKDVAGLSVDELKGEFERIASTFQSANVGSGLRGGIEAAIEWAEGLERRHKDPNSVYGLLTGWTDLDQITLGWQRKDLVVVGARTSVGKSAFATENLIRLARRGHKVGLFSLEMSAEQYRNRMAANIGQVNLRQVRLPKTLTPEQFRAATDYESVLQTIAEIPIDDSRMISTDYITAEIRRQKRVHGLDFVVVDYIQEIEEPPQPNDHGGSALARVVRKLRKVADDCDVCVMALSQLNRSKDGSKEPEVSDLLGSSGIENIADVVILLSRNRKEKPDVLKVDIKKNRNGESDRIVNMHYNLGYQRLEMMLESEEDEA